MRVCGVLSDPNCDSVKVCDVLSDPNCEKYTITILKENLELNLCNNRQVIFFVFGIIHACISLLK